MNCWHCNHELIWGADHDLDEEDENFLMVTNLTCSNCGAYVEVYLPKHREETDGEELQG